MKNIVWSCPLDCSGYSQCGRDYVSALSSNGYNVEYETPVVSALLDGFGIDYDTRIRLEKCMRTKHTQNYVRVSHSVPERFWIDNNADLNIGYTVVETEVVPKSWVYLCNKMDGIFTASTYCKNILVDNGVNVPVFTIPHCHDSSFKTTERYNITNLKKFNFLFMADMTPRKGWERLIEAFCKAFSKHDDVTLTMKVYFRDFSKQAQEECKGKIRNVISKFCNNAEKPDIRFYGHCLPNNAVSRFINTFDCVVSPHSGEGWGLLCSQSMMLGKPVIATDYSGNLEFMTRSNSILVPTAGLVPVPEEMLRINPNYRGLSWPVIDTGKLAESMRWIYENQKQAKSIGFAAAAQINNNFSYERITRSVDSALELIRSNKCQS